MQLAQHRLACCWSEAAVTERPAPTAGGLRGRVLLARDSNGAYGRSPAAVGDPLDHRMRHPWSEVAATYLRPP